MSISDIGMLFQFIGGVGMFLYGMNIMADGMQKTAGSKMSSFLGMLTNNRFLAVALGALITAIIQSSGATTVMVVGFVSAGVLNLSQAVGVIMGTAFSKIVTSIVNDIFMPLIGLLLGGLNFSGLSVQIRDTVIAYGAFIQNVIDFLIVAVCLFLVIRFMAKLTAKKKAAEEAEAKQAPAPAKSDEAVLLEEIRDLLKKESKESAE